MGTSLEEIKALREKTGCGMMDCKAALIEAEGNEEKAVELLRKKGLAKAASKADRVASQGVVESYIHLGGKIGVLVEVNCETDFVAKNSDFQRFIKDVAMQIAAMNPLYVTKEEVPDELIKNETEIMRTQTLAEGKPEKAVDKIVEGRLQKYLSEICLLEQTFIRDAKLTIKDLLSELVAKIGENIVIRRFTRYQMGEKS
ncbi:MAG: translation elongation factor Ts [Candidatus Saganbacteria bacterium]|nr:translation elongation factor Ts [Candidatus Saganbacteria bacterium]